MQQPLHGWDTWSCALGDAQLEPWSVYDVDQRHEGWRRRAKIGDRPSEGGLPYGEAHRVLHGSHCEGSYERRHRVTEETTLATQKELMKVSRLIDGSENQPR